MDFIISFLTSIWNTLGLMAPYLLLGYLVAGILSIFITPELVERHLGGGSLASTVKAALLGMPLPLCSCGVIPVTASLRKHGAGRGATASFLISTPTTGVDSIMAAWSMLGPLFSLYRAFLAVVIGIFGGILANFFGEKDVEEFVEKKEEGSCCSEHGPTHEKLSIPQAVLKALRYGLVRLPKDIGKPLAIGILVAGIISALVDTGIVNEFLGGGFGTMLIMLVIGIPLYVCSTASIPLAIGFIALGASPGAALVFLVSGPATNAATLTVLWKMIGKRSTIAVLLAIVIGAVLGGVLLDYIWTVFNFVPPAEMVHRHAETSGWLPDLAAVALILVQLHSAFSGKIKGWFSGAPAPAESCCSHESQSAPVVSHATASSCCSHGESQEAKSSGSCSEKTPPVKESSCCSEHKPEKSSGCCCSGDKETENKDDHSCCSGHEDKTEKSDCCSGKDEKSEKNDCCSGEKKDEDKKDSGGSCCCH